MAIVAIPNFLSLNIELYCSGLTAVESGVPEEIDYKATNQRGT